MRFLVLVRSVPNQAVIAVQEVELVLELVVDRGVRDVAAGRHIEIMQDERLGARLGAIEGDRQMARMSAAADIAALGSLKGIRESVATP